MSDQSSDSGSSSSTTIANAVLALLTLLGGLYYLNSVRLSSDRPVALSVDSNEPLGQQRIESRLWEDPLKDLNPFRGNSSSPARNLAEETSNANSSLESHTNLNQLIRTIANKFSSNSTVVILPVMLEGGQYSEDRETRIRSRFAVVAGLGVQGFVPEDPEHIGRVVLGWPKESQLDGLKDLFTSPNSAHDSKRNSVSQTNTNSNAPSAESPADLTNNNFLGALADSTNHGTRLDLRYEWFIPREFYPGSANYVRQTNILVLWLNENFFDDDPLVRLPLLLYRLQQTNALGSSNCAPVKVIGPRHSATLKKMLPGQFPDASGYAGPAPIRRSEVTGLLSNIDLFCACPSAMDEVLVSNATDFPREAIRFDLCSEGLHSFHNFAATDAQLASEACWELKLRGADLANTNNHLVLIAEWDTFYSRMVSLTYQATLAVLQGNGSPRNLKEYVRGYCTGLYPLTPPNFHRFYYLQGLDGETVVSEAQIPSKADDINASKRNSPSLDEFRQWQPDANKAEGPSQLDYVARLGDRLQQMDEGFKHTHSGQIKAIGVVGSDVYDTLIILQALHERFPEALFFTTDLDARLWHPKELRWSRNVLVMSGFGLALDPELQRGVSPFRDTQQTAQYAATLAALGNTNLANLAKIPPRRFEIGKRWVVDLSVPSSIVCSNDLVDPRRPSFRLHPANTKEVYRTQPYLHARIICSFATLALLTIALCIFYKPFRRSTWKWSKFLSKSLEYAAEDFGGPDGAAVVLRQLKKNKDPFVKWILAELQKEFERTSDAEFLTTLEKTEEEKVGSWEEELRLDEMHEKLAHALAASFNKVLKHDTKEKPEDYQIYETHLIPGDIHNGARFLAMRTELISNGFWSKWRKHRNLLKIHEESRLCLDALLDGLQDSPDLAKALHPPLRAGAPPDANTLSKCIERMKDAALESAKAARAAAVRILRLRRKRRKLTLLALSISLVVGIALGVSIWYESLYNPEGQGLSFRNGASAWPAQICRFIAIIVAVFSCITIYYRKRIAFAVITRRFRFTLKPPQGVPPERVCAIVSWSQYTKKRGLKSRFNDIFLPFILYLIFCFFIFGCSGWILPFSPTRGTIVSFWNRYLLFAAVIAFLYLTFLTIDTVIRCRKFILKLGTAPTEYPEAVRRHFARLNGDVDEFYLDEWIDIQLIAELTEQIGGVVYHPFLVFCFLLIARNESWAWWSWPLWLVVIFGFNLLLAVACVLILQFAADRAKQLAVANLQAKVKRLQSLAAPNKTQSNADQAKRLLDEISQIRRGAFAHVWQSPLLGAILLPSSGLTIVQALIWVINR